MTLDKDYDEMDVQHMQHFWDLSSDDMSVVISQAKRLGKPKFYINLLNDLMIKKQKEERKDRI